MRKLTLEEKKIINEMYNVNECSRFICTALPLFLQNEEIHINKDTNEILLISGYENNADFLQKYSDDLVDKRMLTLEKNIVILVNLLVMLEQQGYIYFYKMVISDFHKDEIGICNSEFRCTKVLQDTKLCKNIMDLLDFSVITTPLLDDLRSHRFISVDSRKYKHSQLIAIIAIIVSFLIGIVPNVNNYFCGDTQKEVVKQLEMIQKTNYDDKIDQLIDEINNCDDNDKLNEIIIELKEISKTKS